MNGYAVALFMSVAICLLAYVPFRLIYLERVRRENQRYPLFEVRDELVRFKIQGGFDSDPALYDYYVSVCNALIRNTKRVNLRLFLSAMEPLTPENEQKFGELAARTEATPPEVREAIMHLYQASVRLLCENSSIVRVVNGPIGRAAACLAKRKQTRERALKYVGVVSHSGGRAIQEYMQAKDFLGQHAVPAC